MTSRANPAHWDRLLKLIDRRDLIGDKRYLASADRVELEAEVDDDDVTAPTACRGRGARSKAPVVSTPPVC